MRLAVTLRDVALRVGVDISTVSRVLNGDPTFSVRSDTRERVVRVASELNYRPNAIARSLKTRSTMTLGMLIPDITNPLFPAIFKGAEDTARDHGYSIILGHTGTRSEYEDPNIDLLREKRVDGFILATAFTSDGAVMRLQREGYPFVLVNRRAPGLDEKFVVPDDAMGTELVMKHLTDLGHRRIGHIAGPLYTETGLTRFKTYRRYLKENALRFDAEWVQESDFREETGYRSMARLINRLDRPTAVFCANDLVAMGAIRSAVESGLRVPEDVSVVGFNNLPWTDRIQPALTTVHVPFYEMGSAAARMLAQILKGQTPSPSCWVVKPELVVRASTCPPAL